MSTHDQLLGFIGYLIGCTYSVTHYNREIKQKEKPAPKEKAGQPIRKN
jgi:hypothetical protein